MDKSRFIFCKETKNEFNLREEDLPVFMRENVDTNGWKNHVDNNVISMESSNDRNKIGYLSKLKLNTQA